MALRGSYLVVSALVLLLVLLVGVAIPGALLYYLATRLWSPWLAVELLIAVQLVAILIYAIFPSRRLPLDLLLNRAVTAGFVMSLASLLLCLIPSWSSERFPTALQVAVLAALFVLLVRFLSSWSVPLQEVQPVWHRPDLRTRMFNFGVRDEVDAVVFPLLALPVAMVGLISVFAWVTFLLYKEGAISLVPHGTSQVTLGDARAFFLWHFVDAIPLADANKTLNWPEPPFAYKERGVGVLILFFRVALILPAVGAVLAYAKRVRQARARAPALARTEALSFSVWRLLDRQFASEAYERERDLWRRAGRRGDAEESRRAMADLGLLLVERGESASGEHWLGEAATAGDSTAMLNLSALLLGRGATEEGEQWLRKAISAGNDKAMLRLGVVLLQRGEREAGELWVRLANRAGVYEAPGVLGVLEAESGDLSSAEKLLRLAATEGQDPEAFQNLGSILASRGELHEAEDWFRKAAETGDASAMAYLARLLAESDRIEEAEDWFRKAAAMGDSDAIFGLAILLSESGRDQEAKRWLRNAAAAGSIQALRELTTRFDHS